MAAGVFLVLFVVCFSKTHCQNYGLNNYPGLLRLPLPCPVEPSISSASISIPQQSSIPENPSNLQATVVPFNPFKTGLSFESPTQNLICESSNCLPALLQNTCVNPSIYNSLANALSESAQLTPINDYSSNYGVLFGDSSPTEVSRSRCLNPCNVKLPNIGSSLSNDLKLNGFGQNNQTQSSISIAEASSSNLQGQGASTAIAETVNIDSRAPRLPNIGCGLNNGLSLNSYGLGSQNNQGQSSISIAEATTSNLQGLGASSAMAESVNVESRAPNFYGIVPRLPNIGCGLNNGLSLNNYGLGSQNNQGQSSISIAEASTSNLQGLGASSAIAESSTVDSRPQNVYGIAPRLPNIGCGLNNGLSLNNYGLGSQNNQGQSSISIAEASTSNFQGLGASSAIAESSTIDSRPQNVYGIAPKRPNFGCGLNNGLSFNNYGLGSQNNQGQSSISIAEASTSNLQGLGVSSAIAESSTIDSRPQNVYGIAPRLPNIGCGLNNGLSLNNYGLGSQNNQGQSSISIAEASTSNLQRLGASSAIAESSTVDSRSQNVYGIASRLPNNYGLGSQNNQGQSSITIAEATSASTGAVNSLNNVATPSMSSLSIAEASNSLIDPYRGLNPYVTSITAPNVPFAPSVSIAESLSRVEPSRNFNTFGFNSFVPQNSPVIVTPDNFCGNPVIPLPLAFENVNTPRYGVPYETVNPFTSSLYELSDLIASVAPLVEFVENLSPVGNNPYFYPIEYDPITPVTSSLAITESNPVSQSSISISEVQEPVTGLNNIASSTSVAVSETSSANSIPEVTLSSSNTLAPSKSVVEVAETSGISSKNGVSSSITPQNIAIASTETISSPSTPFCETPIVLAVEIPSSISPSLSSGFSNGVRRTASSCSPLAYELQIPSSIPAQLACNLGFVDNCSPVVCINVEPLC